MLSWAEIAIPDTVFPTASLLAIDFETATADRGSACAIGLVWSDGEAVLAQARQLIRPPGNCYDGFNTELHGISSADTEASPSFPEVWRRVASHLVEPDRPLLVAHNAAFDLSVIAESHRYHGLPMREMGYLCTMLLARDCWPRMMDHRLPTIAEHISYSLKHHDPLDDALASLAILAAECRISGAATPMALIAAGRRPIGWFDANGRHTMRVVKEDSLRAARRRVGSDGAPAATLRGKRFAFTGTLSIMTRESAAEAVLRAGGECRDSISVRLDYLVVGSGAGSKLEKARRLIREGASLIILTEAQFIELANL